MSLDVLQRRAALALGWPLRDVQSISFQSLRELVKPVNTGLAAQLATAIKTGHYAVQPDVQVGLTLDDLCRRDFYDKQPEWKPDATVWDHDQKRMVVIDLNPQEPEEKE